MPESTPPPDKPVPATPASAGRVRDRGRGIPRWVFVGGAVAALVLVAIIIVHLSGGGLGGHFPMSGH